MTNNFWDQFEEIPQQTTATQEQTQINDNNFWSQFDLAGEDENSSPADIGKFGETEIVGYTSRFSHAYDIKGSDAFINVAKGYGSFIDAKTEGIRRNNLYGTYLLGPFLIQNPLFTKYLMGKLGVENPQLAFEEDIMKAYDIRIKEFKTDIEFIG